VGAGMVLLLLLSLLLLLVGYSVGRVKQIE
jgi:hypothetical protein